MSGQNSRVVSSLWWYLQELQPLVLMFDLMIATGEGSHMAVVHRVQQSYAVTVTIRPHRHRISSSSHSSSRDACVVIVRGSVANSKAVKEATSVLFEQLTGGIEVVTMMFFSFIVTCKQLSEVSRMWCIACVMLYNKKFELMLTRHTKAYGSFGSVVWLKIWVITLS